MKPAVAPYATSTLCLRVECTNGTIIRVTRFARDLAMSNGAVYLTGSGFDFTGYQATASFSPSAIDLEGILGFAGVTRDALMSGVFDNARCYLFACDFLNPVEDHEPMAASLLGKATLIDSRYQIEEMSLIDTLNQSVGDTYAAACGKRFGGQEFAGCKVDLAAITVTGTLTSVTNDLEVRDALRGEPADYFAYGTLQFTSGANAGLKPIEIKRHASDGTLEVFEPFYYLPAIGDAYILVPGCRKRLEDCRDKWANVLNFGGFPHMPTSSIYSERGTK